MSMDEFQLAGQRIDERYEVERVVAAGGFGTVYFGRHRALRTPVAVKVLRIPKEFSDEAQRDFAQRFLAEARTLAQLQHPAVVKALDFGVSPMPSGKTAPWMALEWVEGPTLREALEARSGAALTPTEALALLRPVIEAIAAAHADGIVHRDIKPANIMLPRGAGALSSRVLDFGIAKAMQADEAQSTTGETRTQSSLAAFSGKYAAPEQVGGLRTGPWTDVHALALVLTEMVTGKEAYAGEDSMSVTAAALSPTRPSPITLGVDVGAWEEPLAKALSFKSADRQRNAGELLAELDAALAATTPPRASKPVVDAPLVESAPRASTSKRGVVMVAALVTLALVGAFAASSRARSAAPAAQVPTVSAAPRPEPTPVVIHPEHVAPAVVVPVVDAGPLVVIAPVVDAAAITAPTVTRIRSHTGRRNPRDVPPAPAQQACTGTNCIPY